MKGTWLIAICICFYSCQGQVKTKSKMERFDIKEFSQRAIGGEYEQTLDDGTRISQYSDDEEYFEKTFPPTGWYYEYKEFYKDGALKLQGKLFKKGDYRY